MTHGDKLVKLAAHCEGHVTLIAPFIKTRALSAILSPLRSSVTVAVYTRWRPEEVVAGVSDLSVFDLVQKRPLSALRLCDTLHAKLYRFDEIVLIGSANLTDTALGWAARPNIELLRRAKRTSFVTKFEKHLFRRSVAATVAIRDAVQEAAQLLTDTQRICLNATDDQGDARIGAVWLPRLRRPQLLYRGYAEGTNTFTIAAREQYADDIVAVAAPPGLGKPAFEKYVRSVLLQNTLVGELDDLIETPQRFGAIRALTRAFTRESGLDRDPAEATQTLLRWLLYFAPDRYVLRTANYSEMLFRK